MDAEKKDAYAEGADAALAGAPEDTNPYDFDTDPDGYMNWNDGWSSENLR